MHLRIQNFKVTEFFFFPLFFLGLILFHYKRKYEFILRLDGDLCDKHGKFAFDFVSKYITMILYCMVQLRAENIFFLLGLDS